MNRVFKLGAVLGLGLFLTIAVALHGYGYLKTSAARKNIAIIVTKNKAARAVSFCSCPVSAHRTIPQKQIKPTVKSGVMAHPRSRAQSSQGGSWLHLGQRDALGVDGAFHELGTSDLKLLSVRRPVTIVKGVA